MRDAIFSVIARRAVSPACASDTNGEIGLAFLYIKRNKKIKQSFQFLHEFLCPGVS